MPFYCIHCRSEIDPKFKACPYCGEPITDFLRRHLETPIDGKYQILSRLGVGGMGEVYKVLHVHLNAIRVIKLMRSNISADPGAHERFLREARLATKIHHPNVGALYDFSTLDDGSRYMVWEYIEGINLHELIEQRGPLSPRYAAKLANAALLGLDAVHRAGIVHRDISPENIMIARDEDGEEHVKIIDLGIAKQWGDEGSAKTQTGMFVGKWKYCSPEHLGMLDPGDRIDGRADLYSFGIVLYEMLTGVPPFQADTPHQYLVLHSSERPRALREVNPAITASPELEALLFRALEKDRRNRFASARDFARALQEMMPSLDDTPGAPPPLPREAEVTAERTRVAATTMRTVAVDAKAVTLKTIEIAAPQPEPAPKRKSRAPLFAGMALVIAVVAGGVAMWKKPDVGRASARPDGLKPVVQKPAEAAVIPVARGRVAVNAFPWAEITSVRNLTSGRVEPLQPAITPAPVELAPGRYEITLSNPSYAAPITKVVDVRPGEDQILNVQFAEPSAASLPTFQ
jgi:eukaryotic-like serine/threonine-protein kinase